MHSRYLRLLPRLKVVCVEYLGYSSRIYSIPSTVGTIGLTAASRISGALRKTSHLVVPFGRLTPSLALDSLVALVLHPSLELS
jgi:hypothetical protein